MTVFRNDGAWDTSNVVFDGDRVVRYDKHEPDPAGGGHAPHRLRPLDPARRHRASAASPRRAPSDLADLFRALSIEGRLAGYEAHERFYEIGSPDGLADLEPHLGSSRA